MATNLDVMIPSKSAYHYPITIEAGLLNNWRSWLIPYLKTKKIVIISDDQVSVLYGQELYAQLSEAGYQVKLLVFPHGEAAKSNTTKLMLEEEMFLFGADRHTLCLALGGGVVGDLAGFVSATYMRGINYIQVPTSLLSMIDSSVGGKTAVNTSYGKNIIGAFWQPKAVIMDTLLLASLPQEQIINGLFEAIKIFATLDKDSFFYCKEHLEAILALDDASIEYVISKAVALKAQVVAIDEHEEHLRMILNFGHTIAHAIEKISNYQILHGYAVAIGMLAEAKIAVLSGMLSEADYLSLKELLLCLEITPAILNPYQPKQLVEAMRGDKKNIDQQISLVLLTTIGTVKNIDNRVSFPVDEKLIVKALSDLKGI